MPCVTATTAANSVACIAYGSCWLKCAMGYATQRLMPKPPQKYCRYQATRTCLLGRSYPKKNTALN